MSATKKSSFFRKEASERSAAASEKPAARKPKADWVAKDEPKRARADKPYGDKPREYKPRADKPYGDKPRFEKPYGDKPRFEKSATDKPREYKPRADKPYGDKPRFEKSATDKPREYKPRADKPYGDKPRFEKPYGDKPRFEKSATDKPREYKPRADKPYGDKPRFDKPYGDKPRFEKPYGDKPRFEKSATDKPRFEKSATDKPRTYKPRIEKPRATTTLELAPVKIKQVKATVAKGVLNEDSVRLNRFIAQSGICSRREADALIESGAITINDVVVTELGTKVNPAVDIIKHEGKALRGEKLVYVIMNKPKGYVTSLDDPHNEDTVITLLKGQVKERVYPVGRLDKNTTGVLLLTNDGELTGRLTHPSYERRKIYHVFLDKVCSDEDIEAIAKGIELEDGEIHADEISFVEGNRKEVGIEIHSGRNRIVRRIFEHLGYRVIKLDRVYFAGLTKMGLKRGFWRYLSPKEVITLKNDN